MKKKAKFIIGGVVVVGVVAALIFSNATHNLQYYKTVDEVLAMENGAYKENLRMSGKVEDGSIQSRSGGYKLKFNILSKETDAKLSVGYNGVVPDTFKPGVEVILEGKLDPDKVFNTEKLITKCPSKYDSKKP